MFIVQAALPTSLTKLSPPTRSDHSPLALTILHAPPSLFAYSSSILSSYSLSAAISTSLFVCRAAELPFSAAPFVAEVADAVA